MSKYVVLGAGGHVGSVVVEELRARKLDVTAIVHDAKKTRDNGAIYDVVDVADPEALGKAFEGKTHAFLLNPPAKPSTDTDVEERKTMNSIVSAVKASRLEWFVAQSTYGAQPGGHIADLGVLYEMEQALAGLRGVCLRVAYLMSNYEPMLETVKKGVLPSMLPPEFEIPMVAPRDVGVAAARLLLEGSNESIAHVEGPRPYTPSQVADAFSTALGRPVELAVTPPSLWVPTMKQQGFSEAAAQSFANMTELTLAGPERPASPIRGTTTIESFLKGLLA